MRCARASCACVATAWTWSSSSPARTPRATPCCGRSAPAPRLPRRSGVSTTTSSAPGRSRPGWPRWWGRSTRRRPAEVPAGHPGAAVLTRVVPTVCVTVLALAPGASGSTEDDAGGGNAVDTDAVVADAVVVADPRLSESSALAVSPRDPDLLYTVNDSGHAPVVFVVDRSGGADSQVVGTTSLAGLDSPDLDPEAIAVAGDVLWVADIGDNGADRTDIALYALPAPGRGTATVRPEHYPLAYPEGLRDDAEALVADP